MILTKFYENKGFSFKIVQEASQSLLVCDCKFPNKSQNHVWVVLRQAN